MQQSCAVTLLVITFLLITSMAALTPVSEKMETFNKRLSKDHPFTSSFSMEMKAARLNQGGTVEEGSLIHTYPAKEEGSLIHRRASSLYQQDMQIKQASTADVKSLITTIGVAILNDNQNDIMINKASSAIAGTAPSNSTFSHASFMRKGREQEEEKTWSKNDNDNNNNDHDDIDTPLCIDTIKINIFNNDNDNDDRRSFSTTTTTTTVNDCSQALEGVIEVMENSSKSPVKSGATSVASSLEGRCVII